VANLPLNQLLHGYKNGHELLAGSTKLAPQDAELVARLSDLSGTLPSNIEFYPYLTIYPLPMSGYYALARTWLDQQAPRPGCVLTHTILVPLNHWSVGAISAREITSHLVQPNRNEIVSYNQPLLFSQDNGAVSAQAPFTAEEVDVFVAKYFGEGLRPIVWFTESNPEEFVLSLLTTMWPNLRMRFAACTLSLQPRTLPTGPFDVLFAPTVSYNRYAKVPREGFIERNAASHKPAKAEPWTHRLSKSIRASEPLPIPNDWPDLLSALGPEPTEVRWLYLLNDLRERTSQSPTATLGTMDIVETLWPKEEDQVDLKNSIADSAIGITSRISDDAQALNLFQLICERLARPAYRKLDDHVYSAITSGVEKISEANIEQGLAAYETFLNKAHTESSGLEAYRSGLVHALCSLVNDPGRLTALRDHDRAASDLVPTIPAVARAYLKTTGNDASQPAKDVARWLQDSTREVNPLELSRAILPLASRIHDDRLFTSIYSKLSDEDAYHLLQDLSPEHIQDPAIEAVIAAQIAPRYSYHVRSWAESFGEISEPVARITAATYEGSREGVLTLLAESKFSDAALTSILVALVNRISAAAIPHWLREFVATSPEFMPCLWRAVEKTHTSQLNAIAAIVSQVDLIAPEAVLDASAPLHTLAEAPPFRNLPNLVMESALIWMLRGRLPETVYTELSADDFVTKWHRAVNASRLANIFAREMYNSADAVQRAWAWLASAPEPLYQSQGAVTTALLDQLIRATYYRWTVGVAAYWEEILYRAHALCDFRLYLRHCVQAVEFALQNYHFPLGNVVREAFPAVYKVVADQSPLATETDRLFSFDWDRGKALRRNLINAFFKSDWAPGDLALAAQKSFGLRKMFRRTSRKWGGMAYLERVRQDVLLRDDPEAKKCAAEMLNLFHNPDFYEPWD
jgi:GTPase-associated protein 1, N-terminal domain type 1